MNQKSKSLVFGLVTILCWGSLATFGTLLAHLPPFYLLGLVFVIGSLPAWARPRAMFPSAKVLSWGVFGYFGYHFLLFYSFRLAPPLEANLINYLWPVFMVILTPLFYPAISLKSYHIAGGALSVIGCVVLVLGKGGELKLENLTGYLMALGAAFLWPIYSIGKKKLPNTSVWAIGGFCFVTGILCLITHFLIGTPVVLGSFDLWKILALGLGPFGLAFYFWDLALRDGDSRILGALAYLTPVISTIGLIVFTDQAMNSSTLWAMILIIGGASVGLLDFLPSKR